MKQVVNSLRNRPSTRLALVALLALGTVWAFIVQPVAQALPLKPQEEEIARFVSVLLQRKHLSGRQTIAPEMWKRSVDIFLENLDPLKLYFYQSDVDEFHNAQQAIDPELLPWKAAMQHVHLASTIFDRYLARMHERVGQVQALLQLPHDFTVEEEIIRDGDAAHYPKTSEEARERWRKRVKFDLLVLTADGEELSKALDRLRRRYTSRSKIMDQTSSEELLEWYLSSLAAGFDPHSQYMSPSTLQDFFILMGLKLEGIGASLAYEDGSTVIKKIIPGGAADKQGELQVEDRIVGVGQGEKGEIEDVVDMKLRDVVRLIRGNAGTIVRLEVIPGDNPGRKILNITRAKIELKDSEARSQIIEWGHKADGSVYRVGVIDLPSFYTDMEGRQAGVKDFKSTTRDVRRLLEQFQKEHVDVVAIDLRRNGGGSLTEAVDMTGLFIDQGPVVQVKDTIGNVRPYRDRNAGQAWSGPLVVLTSKFSASASEIFAGAIQDYGRGIVIGDTSTHGKGTVQQLFDIGRYFFPLQANPRPRGALKLTIQQFYLPDGESTQKQGVLADVVLPSITAHLPVGEGDLDYAMEPDQIENLPHDVYGMVNSQMLESLRRQSEQRRSASQDFAKLRGRIERYLLQKESKTRTLNRKKYLAERDDLTDEEEKDPFDENGTDRPVFDTKEFYNGEALNIAVDYATLLRDGKLAAISPQPKDSAVP